MRSTRHRARSRSRVGRSSMIVRSGATPPVAQFHPLHLVDAEPAGNAPGDTPATNRRTGRKSPPPLGAGRIVRSTWSARAWRTAGPHRADMFTSSARSRDLMDPSPACRQVRSPPPRASRRGARPANSTGWSCPTGPHPEGDETNHSQLTSHGAQHAGPRHGVPHDVLLPAATSVSTVRSVSDRRQPTANAFRCANGWRDLATSLPYFLPPYTRALRAGPGTALADQVAGTLQRDGQRVVGHAQRRVVPPSVT